MCHLPLGRKSAIALLSALISCLAVQAGQEGEPSATVQDFVTKSLAIKEAVVRLHYGKEPPQLYLFRHTSNAFFCRVTSSNTFAGDFNMTDTMCGYYDREYWFCQYTPAPMPGLPPAPPLIYRYSFDPAHTNSTAYEKTKFFMGRFRMLTSLGISFGDYYSPVELIDELRFFHRDIRTGIEARASFVGSPIRPISAEIVANDLTGQPRTSRVAYAYDSSIARGMVPSRITSDAGYKMEILSLVFFGAEAPSPSAFEPPSALALRKDLHELIHTNGRDFHRVQGRSFAVDSGGAERRLKAGEPVEAGSFRTIRTVIIGGMCLSVIIVVLSITLNKKQPKPHI